MLQAEVSSRDLRFASATCCRSTSLSAVKGLPASSYALFVPLHPCALVETARLSSTIKQRRCSHMMLEAMYNCIGCYTTWAAHQIMSP